MSGVEGREVRFDRLAIVTLTGVDASQNVDVLAKMSDFTPYLEWGVLYSPDRAGSSSAGCARYPHVEWIENYFLAAMAGHRKAIHLCGAAVDQFLVGDPSVITLASRFDRIQLNFNQARSPKSIVTLLESIAAFRDVQGPREFILQHNTSNAVMVDLVAGTPGISALFDASGGRGLSPKAWPAPVKGIRCGYAGGLGPENIAQELPRINQRAGGQYYWIDMESKLRDASDRFDISLAGEVLHQINMIIAHELAPKKCIIK